MEAVLQPTEHQQKRCFVDARRESALFQMCHVEMSNTNKTFKQNEYCILNTVSVYYQYTVSRRYELTKCTTVK